MTTIVVHYKELALKGKNRPWFIQLLTRNIRTALAGLHVKAVRSIMGRIEIELGAASPWDEVLERLGRVFGIANFSYANRAPHDFPGLAAAILADLGERDVPSFRVSATRADKRLPFTSPQVERDNAINSRSRARRRSNSALSLSAERARANSSTRLNGLVM